MNHIEQIQPHQPTLPESFLATALFLPVDRLRLSGIAKSRADAVITRIQDRLAVHNAADFNQFLEVLRLGSVDQKEIDEVLRECTRLSRILEHGAAPADWMNLSQVARVDVGHVVRDMMGTRVDGTMVVNVRVQDAETRREYPALVNPASGEAWVASHLYDCMAIGVAPDDRIILKLRKDRGNGVQLWDPETETFSRVSGAHGFATKYAGFSQSLFELFEETAHVVNMARPAFPRIISLKHKYRVLVGRTQDLSFVGIRRDDEMVIDAIHPSGETFASFRHRTKGAGYTHVSVVSGGAVIRADGKIWYWNLSSHKGKKTLLADVGDGATMSVSAVTHPRLPHLLALTYRAVSHPTDIQIFDLRSAELLASYPADVFALDVHANGKLFAQGNTDISIWE